MWSISLCFCGEAPSSSLDERVCAVGELLSCLAIIAPIFVLVGIGYALRARGWSNDGFIKAGTHLVFYIVLPCSLFMNIYTSDFSSVFNPRLVLFVVALHVAAVALLCMVMPRFFPERGPCGIVVQGAFRGNVLLLGLPLAHSIYGPEGIAPTALILAYSIPLYNILAVIVLSLFSDDPAKKQIRWGRVLLDICKNPLVLGTAIAVPFALFQWRLPGTVTDIIAQVGAIGSPLGLILLGAQMRFSSIGANRRPLFTAVVIKLVVFPAIAMAAAILLGFGNTELGAVFILVSAPMSISSFIMAMNMTEEGELAGQMVFVSTALSVLTLLGGLYLLRTAGIL